MRVTSPVVTSVVMTIGLAGNLCSSASLASLKCVSRAAIALPLTNVKVARCPSGAIAPRRSASGSVASTRSASSDSARAWARSIDAGTSGFGVCVTLGNWPSGAICSSTGRTRNPCATSTSMAVMRADAVQRREDDQKSSSCRGGVDQALLAAQVDIGLVQRFIEKMHAAGCGPHPERAACGCRVT